MTSMGSLFAGIGGFDLAAERTGMLIAWQSEIEPYACKVLSHRFPAVPNLGDVTTTQRLLPVGVVTAGFPCQDLSVAGLRVGLEGGTRSILFYEIVRLVATMREETHGRSPEFLVLENVPGLLSSRRGRDFAAILAALEELGPLDIGWRVLDAQNWGVPQRRRRVFIVCDFAGNRAAQVLALTEGGAGHPPTRREAGQGTANTFAANVRGTGDGHGNAWNTTYMIGLGSDPLHSNDVAQPLTNRNGDPGVVAVASCDTGRYGKVTDSDANGLLVADLAQVTSKANRSRVEADRPSPTPASDSQMIVASPLTASGGDHGHSSPQGDGSDNLVAFHLTQDPISGDVSPAMGQGNQAGCASIGTLQHGGVRRLTPVEAERLQGFPDAWTCLHDHPQPCDCPDGARYRALGNAVAVPVVQWLLERIARAMEDA